MILTEGYEDGAERDWLRALRLRRMAKLGTHKVSPPDRLYIVDDVVLLYIPNGVVVYKDERGNIFVDRKDLEKWEIFERFKDMFKVAIESSNEAGGS